MDVDALTHDSFEASSVGPARLPGFELRIGNRATLVKSAGAVSYGVVVDMPARELRRLYSQPGVSDYRAETVDAVLLQDASQHVVQCYNLPASRVGDAVNVDYATRLSDLARALDFPVDYVAHIDALANDQVTAPDAGAE